MNAACTCSGGHAIDLDAMGNEELWRELRSKMGAADAVRDEAGRIFMFGLGWITDRPANESAWLRGMLCRARGNGVCWAEGARTVDETRKALGLEPR